MVASASSWEEASLSFHSFSEELPARGWARSAQHQAGEGMSLPLTLMLAVALTRRNPSSSCTGVAAAFLRLPNFPLPPPGHQCAGAPASARASPAFPPFPAPLAAHVKKGCSSFNLAT